MSLQLEYKDSEYEERGKLIKHKVCKIWDGTNTFTNLGLEQNQLELTQKQKDWLNKHWAEIESVMKQVEIDSKFSWDDNFKRKIYQKTIGLKHKLLDTFCKECDIRDS